MFFESDNAGPVPDQIIDAIRDANNGYHKASPKRAPSVLIKIMSLFSKEMKGMVPFLDTEVSADIAVTKDVFDWCPISFDKTVIETAQSIKPL